MLNRPHCVYLTIVHSFTMFDEQSITAAEGYTRRRLEVLLLRITRAGGDDICEVGAFGTINRNPCKLGPPGEYWAPKYSLKFCSKTYSNLFNLL